MHRESKADFLYPLSATLVVSKHMVSKPAFMKLFSQRCMTLFAFRKFCHKQSFPQLENLTIDFVYPCVSSLKQLSPQFMSLIMIGKVLKYTTKLWKAVAAEGCHCFPRVWLCISAPIHNNRYFILHSWRECVLI